MPVDDGHVCPIDGCKVALNKEFPMCTPHWRLLPEDLRNAMFPRDPWRSGYSALEEKAVISVNEALKKGRKR